MSKKLGYMALIGALALVALSSCNPRAQAALTPPILNDPVRSGVTFVRTDDSVTLANVGADSVRDGSVYLRGGLDLKFTSVITDGKTSTPLKCTEVNDRGAWACIFPPIGPGFSFIAKATSGSIDSASTLFYRDATGGAVNSLFAYQLPDKPPS